MIKKKKQDVLITEKNFNRIKQKVKKIKEENKIAKEKYDLIVIPGIEITANTKGFHLLGLDIKEFIN